jgi:hypothetical protein
MIKHEIIVRGFSRRLFKEWHKDLIWNRADGRILNQELLLRTLRDFYRDVRSPQSDLVAT